MTEEQAILLVDDRPENLLALEQTLKETPARLVKAKSGQAALAATLEQEFALAILDVQMPGMDGFELAELLRGDPKTKHLPIIFLTAASWEEEQIFRGYGFGAVDYIVKPYHPLVLNAKVQVLLDMHAQRLALRRHREQLAAVNRELEAFAYSVSHDLRAPLRAIEGFSQALLEDCVDDFDETGQDYLQRVSGEARRMARLIDDLLALSRVTRAELEPARLDLSAMARAIVARLQEQEPDRSVTVHVADDLVAWGDETLVRQALDNLLSNAWKFTGRTEGGTIEVGPAPEEGRLGFFVRDNGAGFDMKYADKLFTPFQRLHRMDEFPGTGVGLSTVQRIVTRHGGRIRCESAVGEGTTFFVDLGAEERDHA